MRCGGEMTWLRMNEDGYIGWYGEVWEALCVHVVIKMGRLGLCIVGEAHAMHSALAYANASGTMMSKCLHCAKMLDCAERCCQIGHVRKASHFCSHWRWIRGVWFH
jgi:hypothetical protein